MAKSSVPIKITCPECQGCINLEHNTSTRIRTYRCQVGHTYSLKEIIKGKEVQVENSLWTVMGLFEHLEFLYEALLQDRTEVETFMDDDLHLLRERLESLHRQKKLLQVITTENTLPPLHNGD